MIHQLAAQVPDYIRKLERKKVAAEKGRDARDTKISLLQVQIGDLKQEVERCGPEHWCRSCPRI